MNVRDLMRNAPNALIYTVGFIFSAVLAAFTYLSAIGADASELRTFMNTVFNLASTVLAGGALVVSGAAAKSAGNAERQTNGAMSERLDRIERAINGETSSPSPGPVIRADDGQDETLF